MKRLILLYLFLLILLGCKKNIPEENNSLYGNWKVYRSALVKIANSGKTESEVVFTPEFYEFSDIIINDNRIIWKDVGGDNGIWSFSIQTELSTNIKYIQLEARKLQYVIEKESLVLHEFLEPTQSEVEKGIRYVIYEIKLIRSD